MINSLVYTTVTATNSVHHPTSLFIIDTVAIWSSERDVKLWDAAVVRQKFACGEINKSTDPVTDSRLERAPQGPVARHVMRVRVSWQRLLIGV